MTQDIFAYVNEALYKSLSQWMEQRQKETGESRSQLCFEVGKAVMMCGATMMMASKPGVDEHFAVKVAEECLQHIGKRFHEH